MKKFILPLFIGIAPAGFSQNLIFSNENNISIQQTSNVNYVQFNNRGNISVNRNQSRNRNINPGINSISQAMAFNLDQQKNTNKQIQSQARSQTQLQRQTPVQNNTLNSSQNFTANNNPDELILANNNVNVTAINNPVYINEINDQIAQNIIINDDVQINSADNNEFIPVQQKMEFNNKTEKVNKTTAISFTPSIKVKEEKQADVSFKLSTAISSSKSSEKVKTGSSAGNMRKHAYYSQQNKNYTFKKIRNWCRKNLKITKKIKASVLCPKF